MDITQALKDTENSLRDFISEVLKCHYGDNWISECGISEEKINKWKERKLEEEKKQRFGSVEPRLIYYADFYSLKEIIHKKWSEISEFSSTFGEKKQLELWLKYLEDLRNPDAHRRELLPHQKHLLLGIAGEIRTRIIRHRSKMETPEDCFPRIECIRDNLGNTSIQSETILNTNTILYPKDNLEFVVTAGDPFGEKLKYALTVTGHHHNPNWQDNNVLSLSIDNSHVRKNFGVMIWLKSLREYHANGNYDDSVTFHYTVLPPK